MRKGITTFILLVIIFVNAAFCILYISFNLLEPTNQLNVYFRKRVLISSPLRKLFRLSQVGDARYDFMYARNIPLTIHLFYQEGVSLTPKTKNEILNRIQFVTHKYVAGTFEGPRTLQGIHDKVTEEDLKILRTTYAKSTSFFEKSVPLNIFVLNYYTPHPSYAGLVEDANSIFLFKDAIINVSETTDTIPSMEISTILHEFGHLGGAEHIEDPNCIMIDKVESLNFFNKISSIRDSYCEEDVKAIEKALSF